MIREATPDDVPLVLRLVHELAAYERAPHEVRATEDDLRAHLFGPDAAASALIAERDGEPVGFAIWFRTFSTWLGRPGIHLEDLFVRPEARGGGHGRALLLELARIAVERGYGRVEWSVLDWNAPAIGFYEALGARPQDEWTVYRLTGDALRAAASGQSS
ncbi:GNAT family N-acetyltransferase [Actinomadura rayongensis]|uniref:GNAT family N-acetyltransferase n=1 Tax=Actinomadura rayongensis TaxID=1429076 RepID=A0A6I4W9A2_9ACTN|nr:GNAT family N-acetyltransferase [Actinomadura rayongensis]MXQ63312.1 GNAT family N-acetyltransferase [Actinomadura rayongensis]